MLPQNGQHGQRPQQQMQGFSGFSPQGSAGFDGPQFFNLDPGQAAKQMAALNAAGYARIATNSRAPSASLSTAGGTSSAPYVGGITPSANHPLPNQHGPSPMPNAPLNPLLEPSMSQAREQNFLMGLHNLFLKRGQPLPPQITGVAIPNYDHATSAWSVLEPGSEVGSVRLAGKDVNLFRLWGTVFKVGGGQAMTNMNGWAQVLPSFQLPEEYPLPNGSTSVAAMLAQYYRHILAPFEDSYRQSMQATQRKGNAAVQQGGIGGMMQNMPMGVGGSPGQGMQQQPPMNNQRLAGNQQPPRPQSGMMVPPVSDAMLSGGSLSEVSLLDQDVQGIKRKLDPAELDNKRVRPRTDGQDVNSLPLGALDRRSSEPQMPQNQGAPPTPSSVVRPRQQPSRRKIEYVPLAFESKTYGGRDLNAIENEYHSSGRQSKLRPINDWGTVDIEHLTLSIRSRISTELSYALTTFTLLSNMKGHTEGAGFPIINCPELLDEVLDLVEDLAFDGPEPSTDDPPGAHSAAFYTNRQLLNAVLDEQHLPFAALKGGHGSKDPASGPMQRPASYILAVVNIIRNLSSFTDNGEVLAKHDRLVDILLRLGLVVNQDGAPQPVSSALSLSDVISIRKDTLYTLSTMANAVLLQAYSPLSTYTRRIARRTLDLVSSYLSDPLEAVNPLASVQQVGVAPSPYLRPSVTADLALEVLVRFSFPDNNRQVIAKAVPQESLWRLFESLVHRMPITDADFSLMMQDVWMSYVVQLIMAIYILAFLSPSDLKQRMRSDRRLGFKTVVTRMLNRYLSSGDQRGRFWLPARRVTETLKLLDDALDPFENPVDSAIPALSFGMGFADSNDSGLEKGTGLLGADRDLGWQVLMMRDVQNDDIMFRELESLVRVECQ